MKEQFEQALGHGIMLCTHKVVYDTICDRYPEHVSRVAYVDDNGIAQDTLQVFYLYRGSEVNIATNAVSHGTMVMNALNVLDNELNMTVNKVFTECHVDNVENNIPKEIEIISKY